MEADMHDMRNVTIGIQEQAETLANMCGIWECRVVAFPIEDEDAEKTESPIYRFGMKIFIRWGFLKKKKKALERILPQRMPGINFVIVEV